MIAAGESDRVEFTASARNTHKLGEAICAFANDFPGRRQPGCLLVGVRDDGRVSGLTVTDALQRDLGELQANVNLEPRPVFTIDKIVLPDGEVAVIEVQPSDLPPVRYKGKIWIRVGPSRRQANQQEERMLIEKRVAWQQTFDIRPCRGCTLDALTLDLFLVTYLPEAVDKTVIDENERTVEEQMASLRFYDLAVRCPTHAGALLFARDPLHWIPGAWIQFLRLAGTTMADDPIDERRFGGDLVTVLREMKAFVSVFARLHPVADSMLRERQAADYPAVAIRELLLNAIMHRSYESNAPVRFSWYDDRIEIQNPGGLYGAVSPENFPRQTDYRNPVVAEAMATLGYVNRFGRGVVRAQDALRKNGNPDAEFTFAPSYVLVTIRKAP